MLANLLLTLLLVQPDPSARIAGHVLDASDRPVAGSTVVLCDAASGIPVSPGTYQPFTDEMLHGTQSKKIAFAVTDDAGAFTFDDMPWGTYRLVAQSWPGVDPPQELLEPIGKVIRLHGVADDIEVDALTPIRDDLEIRPLGSATLHLDVGAPNDETLLVISLARPRADPILGFAGWVGPFMQYMIGGNRMPDGLTTIHGLPSRRFHVAAFAADNNPGWAAAEYEIPDGAERHAEVGFVASWSNGIHDRPEELAELTTYLADTIGEDVDVLRDILIRNKLGFVEPGHFLEAMSSLAPMLDREVKLPSGEVVVFSDFMAALCYPQLKSAAAGRRVTSLPLMSLHRLSPAAPAEGEGLSYEQAFRALYDELGRNYPCFELKGVDWEAVGETLLPRAAAIEDDRAFGLLCMELIAQLKDSHADLRRGRADVPRLEYPRWDPGFACLIDDRNELVVYSVDPASPAHEAGVSPGMTVLEIDGKSAHELLDETMGFISRYSGSSSERYLAYQAARGFYRQAESGQVITVSMLGVDGTEATFELACTMNARYLPRLPVPITGVSDSANVSWARLGDDLGYIYVRRIRADLEQSLDAAAREMDGIAGLIIDVRGNSGGGFDRATSHTNFVSIEQGPPGQSDRPRFTGPMALLIDARCISAGEGWSSWFIAENRALLFGETTAGASARKTTYSIKDGLYEVRYPVKPYRGFLDRVIEKRGLEPHVPVSQNAADLAEGRDTVLEAAKAYLRNKQ